MRWSDEGFVLSVRRHGETSVIVNLMTESHGRHVGFVRGGASRRQRGTLQPGNLVAVNWHARLEENLGSYNIEPIHAFAAGLLCKPGPLAGLISVCALIEVSLPERESHPELFHSLSELLVELDSPRWSTAYVRWELALLRVIGFGLDLSKCAATGTNRNLIYVSPRTGRAVSSTAGKPYHNKLLELPNFLLEDNEATPVDLVAGLRLTGYFINRHVLAPHGRSMPDARTRFVHQVENGFNGSAFEPL